MTRHRGAVHLPASRLRATTRDELFRYDGLIIGSAEAKLFTPEQHGMIAEFVVSHGYCSGLILIMIAWYRGSRAIILKAGY
jgi:hypothetical protein